MPNDPKDDDSFEDADFEDLDPIEDDDLGDDSLGDESWEEDAVSAGDDDAVTGDIGADDAAGPKKKTFVQKNFMLIVGAVVVVFGGVIGMTLLGGGSAPAPAPEETADALPPADNSAVTELTDSGDMPPMPAPINPGEEAVPAPDGTLTPMPTPEQLENTELAELTVEEVPATPAGKTTPQGEAPFDFDGQQETPAPDDVEGTALELPSEIQAEEETEEPVMNAAERMNLEFRKRADTAPAATADGEAAETVEPAPTLKDEPTDAVAAPDLSPQLEAQKSEIESLQGKLEDQQAQAEKSQQELQASLNEKDQEIAALQKSVKDLEKKLAAAQADVEAAEADAKEASAKAVSAPQDVVEESPEPAPAPAEEEDIAEAEPAPAPKPVTAAKPAAPRESAPVTPKVLSWELKGASPGKAILSSKTSGDTRNVAVGDTVEGLGKITMIARENGRWTVRGTKGQVVR